MVPTIIAKSSHLLGLVPRTCSITKLDLPDRKGRCARKTLENTNRNEKDLPLITLRSKSIYFIIFSLAHIPENNQVEKLVAIW